CYVPKIYCLGPNLNPQNEDLLAPLLLQSPLEWYLCGEEPSVGLAKLEQNNQPSQLCGHVFKVGEPTYSCRECAADPTCVLCMQCFLGSVHKEHRYRMTTSGGGGFCDCGDTEAWKKGPYCQKHEPNISDSSQKDPLANLSDEMIARTYNVFSIILKYAVDMLTWEKEDELPEGLEPPARGDTYYCMLFNDEVHTYEQVIYTLQKAVNCTQKEAVSFATTVDRDGRKSVRFGDFQFCEQAKSVIVRNTSRQTKPLRVQVMHSSVVAHQCFALKALTWLGQIIRYSDALRRILCQVGLQRGPEGENSSLVDTLMLCDSKMWKGARNVYHQLFMSSLLMDTKYKKLFYRQSHTPLLSLLPLSPLLCLLHRCLQNYERLQNDYVKDDHDREFSVTDLSVQMFTVPSLARMLITEENLMTTIIRTFMDHLRHRDLQGHFQFERYTAQQAFKFRRVQSLIGDLKYVLISRPTEWTDQLREKYLESFDAFLELLKCMQGMDPVVRQVGQHIEMEPEWEAAFTLQMKLTHIISMMQEWCANVCSQYNVNAYTHNDNLTDISLQNMSLKFIGKSAGASMMDPNHFLMIMLSRFELYHIFSSADCRKRCSRENANKDVVQQNNTLIEEMLHLVIMIVGERYTAGVGQVECSDEIRREIVHQLCIRSMAHSELVKALPENENKETGMERVIDSVASFKKPGVTGRGLYKLRPECAKMFNLYFHHYSRADQSKAEEAQRKIKRQNGEDSAPGEAPANTPSILALLETLQNAPHLEVHKDMIRWILKTVRDKDKAERKRKAEMARLRREKIMAQMSEMQRHFINENKELFQQSLEELDPSTSSTLEHSPSSCDCTLVCVGPRRWRAGGSERRQVVTCILCQEEQEIRTDGKAMVLAAFVQRSTVMSKNRKRPPHNPDKYDPLFMHPDLSFGTHTGSCGHIMHSHCWQRYFEAVQAKEQRRQQRLRVHTSYNVENGEFLCPLCECLSNTVIPLLSEQPDLSQWLNITSLQMKALNPYSSTIKEMLTTFGTASYKVGLKVHPNEQDPRVPIMCWGSCAYTIQSIERLLVDEEKPLFGSLPCRQDDCLSSLTRFGSACWTVSSHATVQNHFIRLLAALVPDPRVENTPCILDIDMFHLLVSLVLSHPAVFSLDSSGLSADTAQLHFLHLVTVAHIVQILLTSVAEEVRMEQESGGAEREEEEKVCMFYNTLRMHLGSGLREVNSGWHLWRCVKAGILPYLRAAAMFFHYLNGAPAPPELHTLGVGEWEALCGYLCLPSNLLQLFYNNRELMEPLLHGFPRDSNYLIELPGDYSALINQASSFTCPKSEGDKSRAPTLCLVCGAMLCSQSYCCQTELEGEDVGACTAHTFACGAGVGIFLRVRESQVLFLAGKTKGCFYAPPYLDDYGETDQGLRRGNPLHLCQERYRKIQKLWRQHSITEEIGHAQEANQTLVGIDWQHL
uniref:E3 ubiquitin-protein ligase n=1 Tax=Sinocyclocheilus rhinocerous TaxID=307959 RepID=A0A673N7I0_9TELE